MDEHLNLISLSNLFYNLYQGGGGGGGGGLNMSNRNSTRVLTP